MLRVTWKSVVSPITLVLQPVALPAMISFARLPPTVRWTFVASPKTHIFPMFPPMLTFVSSTEPRGAEIVSAPKEPPGAPAISPPDRESPPTPGFVS